MSSDSGTTTQTTGLPPEIAGLITSFGGLAHDAMGMPYQQYQGPRVAGPSNLQNQALGGYEALMGGTPSLWGAEGMLADTLNGQGGNPFTDQVVDRTSRQVTDRYNQATNGTRVNFNSAGGLDSARHNIAQDRNDENLARGLGDSIGSLYSGAYEAERGRQMQAAQLAPNLFNTYASFLGNGMQAGELERGIGQQAMDLEHQSWQDANNYPWSQLERGAGIIGSLQGGMPRQTTTQGPGPDRVSQGLGLWMLGSNMARQGGK